MTLSEFALFFSMMEEKDLVNNTYFWSVILGFLFFVGLFLKFSFCDNLEASEFKELVIKVFL